ncbi:TPA: type I-B CRISPR-associated protein Cas7/Cst2/DevR [Clostridioides difficile]
MNEKRVKGVTLTILTESPVPLSYDQGYGNYTPIKKEQYREKIHAKTSIATITYDLRRMLHQEYGWNLSNIVFGKKGNIYPSIKKNVGCVDENGLETDVFGYLIPLKDKGSISKASPLRIIPFRSLNPYKGSTQLITNRGFLSSEFGRKYYDEKEENEVPRDENFPTSQALAIEETLSDYYVYTITLELDRIGVVEVEDGKLLLPEERKFMSKELREKAVKDILDAITVFTRNIKHSSVLLKPLAVIGGAFDKVVPFFLDDVDYNADSGEINLEGVIETIESYSLKESNTILAINDRLKISNKKELNKFNLSKYPVKEIKNLADRLEIGEDNMWYLKE